MKRKNSTFNIINRLTLRMRIFIALVVMILFTSVTIGLMTFFHFQQTTKVYHENRLARKEKTIIETIDYAITDYPEEASQTNIKAILENKIFEYADINDIPINIYNLRGELILTSEAKITNERRMVPDLIVQRINPTNDRFEVRKTEGENTFLTTYSLIYNIFQQPIAIVSLPYLHDDSFLKEELISLLERFIGVVLVVLAVGALVSWWISTSITGRLIELAEILQSTHMVKKNREIQYQFKDEVSILVKSYNSMLRQLNEQSEQLLKIEREETWREAARQVAHELKNPLTPMRLQMQNFQRKFDVNAPDVKERVNELVKGIIKQIDTLSGIAEAFSDFTRMPMRKDEKINLIEEIDVALELFDEDVIQFDRNQAPIVIQFDPNYLVRIIMNLVKNSIQAMPINNKPEISIDLVKKEKVVEIWVKDNGQGISDEIADRLLEPQFTTKSSGSGLGLPMVNKMVQSYDGNIRFRNNPEGGATFIVTIPLNLSNEDI